ncbi:sugar phosphate isomerase/epimerase [Pedobacter sp. MC2016-24]|uniref:sugar phosphate isomerase/epimerase family protein n=1 Tax=Pedobacter sp. MC2016-24 TaxID=2780090 RepID=UPI00187E31CD|nr:sugar phosphate isomerase/epimerase [Pedobacter sp. MC2016-24]MBE9598053.1 sugar phosphate isomerase/epimerase [Pedobacter sp. MC2016-24]
MDILFFCTTWGQKKGSWDAFFASIAAQGYDGVETGIPDPEEKDMFFEGLHKYGLRFIGQHWETTDPDISLHRDQYAQQLRELAALKPLFINSHTGRDFFTKTQNCSLLEIAASVTLETDIPVVHETHRGRFAYAAHVTAEYLKAFPDLRLTLDVSHWCVVAESLLQDQQQVLDLAIGRTAHIHARIGFEQGPQVWDPELPEYGETLDFHLKCWDKVIASHQKTGKDMLSITPEFGPFPYLSLKQTAEKQCLSNLYMMNLLKTRYQLN